MRTLLFWHTHEGPGVDSTLGSSLTQFEAVEGVDPEMTTQRGNGGRLKIRIDSLPAEHTVLTQSHSGQT